MYSMMKISNIVKGFVAMAALAILVVGCEKGEFDPINDGPQNITKGGDLDWGADDGGNGGNVGDPTDPNISGKIDSIKSHTPGAIEDPFKTPFNPLNRIKDDRVRDGSDNEEDDDGEDNGGRQSSMTDE